MLQNWFLISGTELSTLSSWSSGARWSLDSSEPPPYYPPQPPCVLPSALNTQGKTRSSGSSGLGSSDEITYAPIMSYSLMGESEGFDPSGPNSPNGPNGPNGPKSPGGGSYFSNNIYGMDHQSPVDQFSTFRPLPETVENQGYKKIRAYANQHEQYLENETVLLEENGPKSPESIGKSQFQEEDEGINTMTPPKTPADDYFLQFSEQMTTSSL